MFTEFPTPLGPMIGAASGAGVCLLEFTDRRALPGEVAALERHYGRALERGAHAHLSRLAEELAAYFAGGLTSFGVPLDLPGTDFQRRVWARLAEIPFGETVSYERVALDLACPGGQRAVGRANGQNRVSIVVPCHRVVEKGGALRGYGGGLARKRALLELESGTLWEGGAELGNEPRASARGPENSGLTRRPTR